MAFELVPVERSIKRDAPTVSLSANHFTFNSYASKIIDLEKLNARLYVDEEARKIKFEFVDEPPNTDKHVRAVFPQSSKTSFRMSSTGLQASYKFIKKLCLSRNPKERVFELVRERPNVESWIATLAPSFENECHRDDCLNIPSDATGIYRYLSEGKVVYIGKGNVRKRLGEEQRKSWIFNKIEYSIINDSDEAYGWESHWINLYKAENNGDRPIYNLVSGHGQE